MNPNRLNNELRRLPGNVRSPHFPGGTLISAVLDRKLMTWSDRGGASRIFGEIWSEYTWEYLSNGAQPFLVGEHDGDGPWDVIRLDDNPKLAIQAGRNQLPNPDFLLLHNPANGSTKLRAVDAKFAVDRLRRTQISAESIRELVELPGSLARQTILDVAGEQSLEQPDYLTGMFIGPATLLNNYFEQRLTSGDSPRIPPNELLLIEVESDALFQHTEEFPLIQLLKSADNIDVPTPESQIVLDMYYLRLACAARWFETRELQPLLSLNDPDPAETDQVYTAIERRIRADMSAYELIERWSKAAVRADERQKLIKDAARLPVRMSEIRKLVDRAGLGDDRKIVRQVRGALEKVFMQHLINETGEIPSRPHESMQSLIQRVASTSRQLRAEMLTQANQIIERIGHSHQSTQ